jgi:hypothetical protein
MTPGQFVAQMTRRLFARAETRLHAAHLLIRAKVPQLRSGAVRDVLGRAAVEARLPVHLRQLAQHLLLLCDSLGALRQHMSDGLSGDQAGAILRAYMFAVAMTPAALAEAVAAAERAPVSQQALALCASFAIWAATCLRRPDIVHLIARTARAGPGLLYADNCVLLRAIVASPVALPYLPDVMAACGITSEVRLAPEPAMMLMRHASAAGQPAAVASVQRAAALSGADVLQSGALKSARNSDVAYSLAQWAAQLPDFWKAFGAMRPPPELPERVTYWLVANARAPLATPALPRTVTDPWFCRPLLDAERQASIRLSSCPPVRVAAAAAARIASRCPPRQFAVSPAPDAAPDSEPPAKRLRMG